jgi:hypothetical protein
VVWQDSTLGNEDIFYRSSTDGGATFGPTINLSVNDNFSGDPGIAVLHNTVHIVWNDATPGNLDVFYRRSTDGGTSFESTQNLSNNAGLSFTPAIAASGTNVHVV